MRVAVVGAGGWMGLASLELLHRRLGEAAFRGRVIAFGSAARRLRLREGLEVDQKPLETLADLAPEPTVVLHLAFLTQEKAKAMSEADYVAANTAISGQVLEALDRIGAIGVFNPSSGAAYMVEDPAAPASMRLYGRLKMQDEAAFCAWAKAGDGRCAAIARVFNLSGPYINKQSSYALACFIADALAGRPIEVRATRPVWRSFVAISELMSVALGVLGRPPGPCTRFDTAGDETLEMSEIAAAVKAALGAPGEVVRSTLDSASADRYVGDGALYRDLRGRAGVAPTCFRDQILTTATYMGGTSSQDAYSAPAPDDRSATS